MRRASGAAWSLIALLALPHVMGCDTSDPDRHEPEPIDGIGSMPYRLDAPVATFTLPEDLLEISGITLLPDGSIGAVQDEVGTIYVISPTSGEVIATRSFGEAGDYEDIALAGERLFVLRADGDLIEISGWSGDSLAASTFESGLRPRNDPEGLTFSSEQNRLLIACKGHPGGDLDEDEVRTVYAYDLVTRTLIEEPVLTMMRDTVDAVVDGGGKFAPSAVDLNPLTEEVYVVSSDLRALVAYAPDGTIRAARRLPKDLFEQPEGLLFLPNGDMLISSEGVDGPGVIHRFEANVTGSD